MLTAPNRLSASRPKYTFPSLFTFLLGIVLLLPSTIAYAAIPDGNYSTTSVSGNFESFGSCPGIGFTPYSGAIAALAVSGSSVNLTVDLADGFTFSGSGTQSASTLDLTAAAEVISPPSGPGDPKAVSIGYTLSGSDVIINSFVFSGTAGGGLCNVLIDWNAFTMIGPPPPPPTPGPGPTPVTTTPTPTYAKDDPIINPSSNITNADAETLDRAISSFVVPVQNRTRGFHLQTLQGGQGVVSTFSPSSIKNGLMLEGTSGMNAGDTNVSYGAWTSYSYSDFENNFFRTRYDGNRHTVMAGIDVSPWEQTLFGIAVGWEDSDFDTTFNRGEQDTDGFTIFPYFGGLLTDTWSVDFGFGYSSLDTDQFRTDPTTNSIITSSPDFDRWFGMLNINGLTTYGNWIIGGRIGFLYAQQDQDAFTESDGTLVTDFKTELGQWNLGADFSYSYGNFEPYAKVTYEHDFNQTEIVFSTGQQPSNDNDNVIVGAGVRYFNSNNISGYIDWYKRLDREDADEDTITFSLRIDF